MYDSINIDLLYVFVTVSELKSINKSSEVLLLSQPAISNKIKKLEEYFGKKLLDRSTKGVCLTEDGKLFYRKAKNIIDEFDELHHLHGSNNYEQRFSSIKIGTFDSISSFLFPEFFATSLKEMKSVMITNKISELICPFNDGKLDIIIADSELKKGITIKFSEQFIYSEPYYVVFSTKNTLNNNLNKKITAMELQNCKLILHPQYCPIHNKISRIYKDLNINLPEIYEVNYDESTISFIRKSDYVTVLPKSIAISKVASNKNMLCMRELEFSFRRNISIFSNNKIPMNVILNKMGIHNKEIQN